MSKRKNYQYYEPNAFGYYGFGPIPSEPQPSRYAFINKLLKIEEEEKRIVFYFLIGKEQQKFYLEFPIMGGFRFYGDCSGFFKPQSLLEPNKTEDGYLTADGYKLNICDDEDEWYIALCSESGELVRFDRKTFRFGYCKELPEKIKITLPLDGDERLTGCGERFSGLDQTGKRHQFWNCDCGYHGKSEFLELWKSYKNIPLLHSTKGYSLFFSSFYPAYSDLGFSYESVWYWEFWGPTFDIYVWGGNPRETVVKYTDLTGKSFLPPKWAFKYMSGGGNGFWYGANWGQGNIPEKYLAVLKDVLEGYEKTGTPNIAALYGEGWIAYNDDAYEMLKPYGTRMLSWNPPDYPLEYERALLPGVSDSGLPRIKRVDDPEKDAGNYIDFFNPHVKEMLVNRYKKYFEKGLHGGMLDFAEMVPENALYCNGMTGREMHNFNPYWYGKLYGEAAKEILGDDYLYYCRGGCAGSQQWAANFSGDQAATFYGLKQQLSSALTLGLCGISAWGADLAGYENTPETDVFIRGIQFSTFQPLMRAHGTRSRCPWDFGEKAIEVYKYYYWLRENMVDTLYSNAIKAHKSGLPMMQAMAVAFPEERKYSYLDTQYLFCDDFLVCPVMERNAEKKEVFFPRGTWYDLYSGKTQTAGEREIDVCIEKIPVFIKSGAVIPMRGERAELSAAFESDKAIRFLVLTPPEEKTVTEVYYDKDKPATVFVSAAVDTDSYLITSENCNITEFIVYGGVSEVAVDGKPVNFVKTDINENCSSVSVPAEKWNSIKISGQV